MTPYGKVLPKANPSLCRHFAVVAALAMLISVVYDPFIQNLVSYRIEYPDEERLGLPPSAQLSYATTYDALIAGGSESKPV
jgi:hypothetical protein